MASSADLDLYCFHKWLHLGSAGQELMLRGRVQIRPRDYKTVFMLNSTEHKISNAHKSFTTDK